MKLDTLLRSLGACSDARAWAKGKTLTEAWDTCERADWMLWLVGRMEGKEGWPDRKAIVGTACDCAELALPYVKKGDDRPAKAIAVTRSWIHGEASLDDVRNAADAADAAADAANAAYAAAAAADATNAAYAAAAAAAYAAAYATYAAAAYAAAYAAADAAAYAAYAAADAAAAARKEMQSKCVAIVRKLNIPTEL